MNAWIRFTIASLAAWFAFARLIESQDRRMAQLLGGSITSDVQEEKPHALASFKAAA